MKSGEWREEYQDEQNKNWRAVAAMAVLPTGLWALGMYCDQFLPIPWGRMAAAWIVILGDSITVPTNRFRMPILARSMISRGAALSLLAAVFAAGIGPFGFRHYDEVFFFGYGFVVLAAFMLVLHVAPVWIRENTLKSPPGYKHLKPLPRKPEPPALPQFPMPPDYQIEFNKQMHELYLALNDPDNPLPPLLGKAQLEAIVEERDRKREAARKS